MEHVKTSLCPLAWAISEAKKAGKAEDFQLRYESYRDRHGVRGSVMLALDDLELIDRKAPLRHTFDSRART